MKRGAAVCYPGRVWGYHDIGDDGISLALFLCVVDKEELMVAG